MFRPMKFDLGDHYYVKAIKEDKDIAIKIYHNHKAIGGARLTTDNVDVSCITKMALDKEHVNHKFNNYTLGEVLLKLLIKFPTMVRKPEFRFILNVPHNLKSIIAKYHFDRGDNSTLKNEIMIRKVNMIAKKRPLPVNVTIKSSLGTDDLQELLSFLKNNAYWQSHLTLDRLKLLTENAYCFFAISSMGEIIGFSRVVTNNASFASLWDVVVDKRYQRKGIGTALMTEIFSDANLKKILNWVLFTDTAKKFYEEFGFISAADLPNRNLVHKLRLQDSHPDYMAGLIQIAQSGLTVNLDKKQSFQFLFGVGGKRANLSSFWKEASPLEEKQQNDAGFVEAIMPEITDNDMAKSVFAQSDTAKRWGYGR